MNLQEAKKELEFLMNKEENSHNYPHLTGMAQAAAQISLAESAIEQVKIQASIAESLKRISDSLVVIVHEHQKIMPIQKKWPESPEGVLPF